VNPREGHYGSRPVQAVFFCLGCLFVGLATVGVVLPLIPTTPFLLLAAACYARSSKRFYDWLLTNRIFGPTIRQWQESGSVAMGTKVVAIVLLVLTLGSSVVFFVPLWSVKILLVAVGIWVIYFLLRLPTAPSGSDSGI
jgi:uncharacterized membrane protein YbaN (DUF454 family)